MARDTPTMTETERLLAEAREICLRVHGSAPDELVAVVFQRRCLEADVARYEGDRGEALH